MELLSSNLPASLFLLVIGVIIGAALTKVLNKGPKNAELQQELQKTREDFEDYQQEVGSHFQKTADLVNQLTHSYREVHEHLSSGAQKLAHHSPNTLQGTEFKALADDSDNPSDETGENQNADVSQENSAPEDSSSETKPEEK